MSARYYSSDGGSQAMNGSEGIVGRQEVTQNGLRGDHRDRPVISSKPTCPEVAFG